VHDGNVVAVAFKSRIKLDFPALIERAKTVKESTKMPTKSWIEGLKHATDPA
jgi:hypothetical protein